MAVRDIFFDDFYSELEHALARLDVDELQSTARLEMKELVAERWHRYSNSSSDSESVLIAVDGGVQKSEFSHGWLVCVGRACATIYDPTKNQAEKLNLGKQVKIYIGRVFDERDKTYIPSYVRSIAEYSVAYEAAKSIVDQAKKPIVLMDGSLYLSRFPFAEREYLSHSDLLMEFFEGITRLHALGREHDFPVASIAKDSSVFYLHMALLKELVAKSGLERHLVDLVAGVNSPLALKSKIRQLDEEDRKKLSVLVASGLLPLCDVEMLTASVEVPGFSHPLILAPAIFFSKMATKSNLYSMVENALGIEKSGEMLKRINDFFALPPIVLTYWIPYKGGTPFRFDISGSALDYVEPSDCFRRNMFVEDNRDLSSIKRLLDHLNFWFCNLVEYNIPLRQSDRLARFDRALYKSRYEPFIIKSMERFGIKLKSRVRDLREGTV